MPIGSPSAPKVPESGATVITSGPSTPGDGEPGREVDRPSRGSAGSAWVARSAIVPSDGPPPSAVVRQPSQRPAGASAEGLEKAGPPLLLAERWDNATDLAGWWMSEKLDGVRAYWDGRALISRLGNAF